MEAFIWSPPAGVSLSEKPQISEMTVDPSLIVVEAVVVNPYRTVSVGALVGGPIESFPFEKGDFVQDGALVVQIWTRRPP